MMQTFFELMVAAYGAGAVVALLGGRGAVLDGLPVGYEWWCSEKDGKAGEGIR